MKKPWRFTKKQVQSYYVTRARWSSSYHAFVRMKHKKQKNVHQQQLWLELHNWIDDGLYLNHHKHSASWDFW